MTITKNSVVYCDANFLIALACKRKGFEQPERKWARILFAQLLASGCKIIVSTLTFDETWLGIRKESGPKSISNNLRFTINELMKKIGVKLIDYGASEFSCAEIFDDLNFFTNRLLSHRNFLVVQFGDADNGVKNALENIKNFKWRPRDSFHLALMRDNAATDCITGDNHFIKNKNQIDINIINFKNL